MKLSQMRMCDQCGGPLRQWFNVVRISQAMVSPRAVNEVLGLTQMLGGTGHAFAIAEVMASDADGAIVVLGEREPSLWQEALLCQECGCGRVDLGLIRERVQRAKEEQEVGDV